MSDKIKQLESQILVLKARLFDVTDQRDAAGNEAKVMGETIQKIVELIGLEAKEDGTIMVEDILGAISALVSVDEGE